MDPLLVFRMPTPVKITGRSSSVTNSFVNSIIPVVPPRASEIAEALSILGMSPETIACAYCGDRTTEWDHLRPLVAGKRPTGYVSEIGNLVPACGKCNQSKGNRHWEEWILSSARLSPKTRGVAGIQERMERLRQFEAWRVPTKVDFEAVVGAELWAQHWRNCDALHTLMRTSQETADSVQDSVLIALRGEQPSLGTESSAIRQARIAASGVSANVAENDAAVGEWNEFERWLVERGYDQRAARSRVSNLRRVEQAHGALGGHFSRDRCSSLLNSLTYSTADKDRSVPNPSLVTINGDIYNGLATLRSAVNAYVVFRNQSTR